MVDVFRSASSPRPSPPLKRGGEGAKGGRDVKVIGHWKTGADRFVGFKNQLLVGWGLRPGQARRGGAGGQSGIVGPLLGHRAADSGPATAGGARQLDVYHDQCPFPESRVLPPWDSQPGAVTLINFVMRTEVDQEQGFPAGFGIFLTGKDDPTVIAGRTGVETF